MLFKQFIIPALVLSFFVSCNKSNTESKPSISGIYPHLAYYNNEDECGTGAVVPWADRLWVITYGPHLPLGSSDKLYEITPDLKQIIRPESIGGTPANRMIHKESQQLFLYNEGNIPVTFTFEVDKKGDNNWRKLKSYTIKPLTAVNLSFTKEETGEWLRVFPDIETIAAVHFWLADQNKRNTKPDKIFHGLATVNDPSESSGFLWGLGNDRRSLGILAGKKIGDSFTETGYYELNWEMELVKKEDSLTASYIRKNFTVPKDAVIIDNSSVLIIDDKGRRWRLPKRDEKYSLLHNKGLLRICREVVTERDLFNCHGTFYELPAENADGYAKIRPVASHNFLIHDYASYRGLLIMTGLKKDLPKKEITVNPGETFQFTFPDMFQARWIRFVSDKDCVAKAWLVYE